MQINNGRGGEYFRMVQLQQMAAQKENFNDFIYRNDGKNSFRMSPPPSPVSLRKSTPRTPVLSPFSPALSIGTPYSYSIYDPDDESFEDDLNQLNYPAPSQWRLLKMNAPEWGRGLTGCLAAIGAGAVQPINAYCAGSLMSNYFRSDKSAIKHKSNVLALIFLFIGALNFITSLLQHYNFAIMGERLTKRVREKLLAKLMTFEIGWFDDDENTSAAICARLATEASMVRSLVGDRMSLLVQTFFGSVFAYSIGLVLTWRLTLVMIAVQPLVIGSFYLRSVLMKSMAGKAQKAQMEGSQLASEAVINHRTIAAFSSEKRMLRFFKATFRGPKEESVKHFRFWPV
jgi:ATP-binding cassette subfamily B (MDR/TAP) protein 1